MVEGLALTGLLILQLVHHRQAMVKGIILPITNLPGLNQVMVGITVEEDTGINIPVTAVAMVAIETVVCHVIK